MATDSQCHRRQAADISSQPLFCMKPSASSFSAVRISGNSPWFSGFEKPRAGGNALEARPHSVCSLAKASRQHRTRPRSSKLAPVAQASRPCFSSAFISGRMLSLNQPGSSSGGFLPTSLGCFLHEMLRAQFSPFSNHPTSHVTHVESPRRRLKTAIIHLAIEKALVPVPQDRGSRRCRMKRYHSRQKAFHHTRTTTEQASSSA